MGDVAAFFDEDLIHRLSVGTGLDCLQFVAEQAFSRRAEIYDSTLGWRFVNPLMQQRFGIDSMPETAENVAVEFNIEREAQEGIYRSDY